MTYAYTSIAKSILNEHLKYIDWENVYPFILTRVELAKPH
jgi:hypothetical protein